MDKYSNAHLEIAKMIGEPINYALPVPVEIAAIADIVTLEPGEFGYRFSATETTADYILTVSAGGKITPIEASVVATTAISLTGYQSKLEWIEVNDILGSPDLQIFARRKEAIARSLDKNEIKTVLDGILASTNTPSVNVQEASYASGDDIYDLIMKAKQKVEDYGDKYVLLCGSAVKNAIDTYDKDKGSTLHFDFRLESRLNEMGIEVMKIFGLLDSTALLNTNKFILLAKNSRHAEGKPVKFVRRRISADIAKLMGADVDKAQRALIVNPTPVVHATGAADAELKLAFGVYGYEQAAFVIPQPKSICFCDASSAL